MRQFTAIVHQEESWSVANCPEVGTVSQGRDQEEAVNNLKEATQLYLEEMEDIPPFTTTIQQFELA